MTKEDKWSDWLTYKKVPELCRKGDPVFFWSSGRLRAIVGLGTFRNPRVIDRYEEGNIFHLNHISQGLFPESQRLGIDEIKTAFRKELSLKEFNNAKYIKPAVVATIYEVTNPQARILIRLLLDKQPRNKTLMEWRHLANDADNPTNPAHP